MIIGNFVAEIKVGDTIDHHIYRTGIIQKIRPEEKYPIEVYFRNHGGDGLYTRFTVEGKEVGKNWKGTYTNRLVHFYGVKRIKKPKRKIVEETRISKDMLWGLMQGKDIEINHLTRDDCVEVTVLRSPMDGVFLTHRQIQELQVNSENSILNVFDKLARVVSVETKE